MLDHEHPDPPPWYRQFWPWFLFGLPATAVVAGFATLYLALQHPHSMVDDNYYEDGLAINQSLDQDREATRLGLHARVRFDESKGRVQVQLQGGDHPKQLELRLRHPVSARFDQNIKLKEDGDGSYSAAFTHPTQTHYYLRLVPGSADWRLNGEVDFRYGSQVLLDSQ